MNQVFSVCDGYQSCDTMAVSASHSALGSNMFIKNSDRMSGESQPMTYVPPADHAESELTLTGGFVIPQVPHTYGVTGSGPYWIWGFEMGVNEHGLIIGNEAEFDRDLASEKEKGILGMDLLRLALERTRTAGEAIRLMADLLEKYGQKRSAMPHSDEGGYDNSYMIMDPDEIWIFETAGRRWVAKKASGVVNIGNAYSIHGDFDLASEDIEEYARKNRWQMADEAFDFARAYGMSSPYQTIAQLRRRRVLQLGRRSDHHTVGSLKAIFRDHYEGEELLGPLNGASSGLFPTVCRHACNMHSGETAASMIGWYSPFGFHLRWAFAPPCCSVYIPVYYGTDLPGSMTIRSEFFEEESLWWQFERLGKMINLDYDRFGPAIRERFGALEALFEKEAEELEGRILEMRRERSGSKEGEPLLNGSAADDAGLNAEESGAKEEAALLAAFTADAARRAMEAVKEEYASLAQKIRELGGPAGPAKEFFEEYCAAVRIPMEPFLPEA